MRRRRRPRATSVEVLSAVLGAAEAHDLLVFDGELVVVGDLLAHGNGLLRVDHDLLLSLHRDDFGITIWLEVDAAN